LQRSSSPRCHGPDHLGLLTASHPRHPRQSASCAPNGRSGAEVSARLRSSCAQPACSTRPPERSIGAAQPVALGRCRRPAPAPGITDFIVSFCADSSGCMYLGGSAGPDPSRQLSPHRVSSAARWCRSATEFTADTARAGCEHDSTCRTCPGTGPGPQHREPWSRRRVGPPCRTPPRRATGHRAHRLADHGRHRRPAPVFARLVSLGWLGVLAAHAGSRPNRSPTSGPTPGWPYTSPTTGTGATS
jgi:hypothetical protein